MPLLCAKNATALDTTVVYIAHQVIYLPRKVSYNNV